MRKVCLLFMSVLGVIVFSRATVAYANNIVVEWNKTMLSAIAQNPPAPTATTWRMHVVSTAMYNAWTAYDAVAWSTTTGDTLRRPVDEHTEENQAAAISYAAYWALTELFPNQQPQFDALMAELGYPLTRQVDTNTPAGLGNQAARDVLHAREQDGSNWQNGFADSTSETFAETYTPVNSPDPEAPNAPGGPAFNPNRWQPLRVPNGTMVDEHGHPTFDNADPSTYTDQVFTTPHWGAVTPFALTSGDQFRPPAPPKFASSEPYEDALGNVMTNHEAWNIQFDELLDISATLTDRQKAIAEFWADGPRTWTPPGHWNQLAQGIAIRDDHALSDSVKMYFALNAALLDAGIAAWDAKRVHDCIRPVSAIRHKYFGQQILAWGGPDQGTQLISGETWRPYQSLTFVTPPFSEFVSGHSTFSRAAREVLLAFSGTDVLYDGVTRLGEDWDGDGEEDLIGQHVLLPGSCLFENCPATTVVLQWTTLLEAADEAGVSRRYGGIHIQDGDLRAREMGRQIGQQAFAYTQTFWLGDQ